MAKLVLDLTQLTPAEKLELIDRIWSSMTVDELPLTAAQRTELHHRLDHLDEESPKGPSWGSVLLR